MLASSMRFQAKELLCLQLPCLSVFCRALQAYLNPIQDLSLGFLVEYSSKDHPSLFSRIIDSRCRLERHV